MTLRGVCGAITFMTVIGLVATAPVLADTTISITDWEITPTVAHVKDRVAIQFKTAPGATCTLSIDGGFVEVRAGLWSGTAASLAARADAQGTVATQTQPLLLASTYHTKATCSLIDLSQSPPTVIATTSAVAPTIFSVVK